ncbi:hypothetical protein ACS0TY_018882 [Phlomoides rotata]
MSSFLQRVVIPLLIFTIATPISMGDFEEVSEPRINDSEISRYLRDLCSDTEKSKQCWKIIEPEINRFTDTDIRNIAGVVIDLAIVKSRDISDQLNQLYRDSGNDALKEKYRSCSQNYYDANSNLDFVRRSLNSGNFQEITSVVDNAEEELKSCKREFGRESFDPAHTRNRNKEFRNYVDIVRTATNRFLRNIDRKA